MKADIKIIRLESVKSSNIRNCNSSCLNQKTKFREISPKMFIGTENKSDQNYWGNKFLFA